MTFAERIADYEEAEDKLQTMIDSLIPIKELLEGYHNLLEADISRETLAGIGVTLTVTGENLTDDNWTEERIRAAYDAVIAIIDRIADESQIDKLFELMIFKEVFGGVTITLFEGNFGDDSYASTSDDGNTIFLYTQPTVFLESDLERCGERFGIENPLYADCVSRDFVVHSARNIIHEFGHVLLNRYDESGFFASWDQAIRIFIDPFDTSDGWTGNQFDDLQNNSEQSDVNEGRMSQIQLENERIANMFEAWVLEIEPQINSTDPDEARRAWAMWTFMTGDCPPADINVPCSSMGFIDWIKQFGGLP